MSTIKSTLAIKELFTAIDRSTEIHGMLIEAAEYQPKNKEELQNKLDKIKELRKEYSNIWENVTGDK